MTVMMIKRAALKINQMIILTKHFPMIVVKMARSAQKRKKNIGFR